MKSMIKPKLVFVALFCALLSCASNAAEVVTENGGGGINWTKGIIYANGYGVAPANSAANKKRLLARRAAQVDAYRNLAEIVSGVRVSSETLVRNMESASDVIRTKLSAVVRGAVTASEHYQNEVFTVQMQIDMNGPFFNAVKQGATANRNTAFILRAKDQVALAKNMLSSLGDIPFWPQVNAAAPNQVAPLITDTRELEFARKIRDLLADESSTEIRQILEEEITRLEGQFGFSGLLIDASSVADFELATIPRIRDTAGAIIYPTDELLESDQFTRRPVSYDFDLEDAIRNARVSINPFIIKALGVYKARKSDLVISESDAALISTNPVLKGIMNETGVMIVVAD